MILISFPLVFTTDEFLLELSRVALPSHTQSCAFVVVSLGLRFSRWMTRLPGFTGAALTPGAMAPSSALNFEAYTTHDTTKTTMAQQKVPNRTYMLISNGVMCWVACWRNTPLPPWSCLACTLGSCESSSFNGVPETFTQRNRPTEYKTLQQISILKK